MTYGCFFVLAFAAFFVALCAYSLVAFGVHAWREYREGLAIYLCNRTGQGRPPRWLSPILTGLALLLTAGVLVAALFLPEHRYTLLAFLAGAVPGDTVGTHLVPTWLSKKPAPALETWWVYLLVAAGWWVYLLVIARLGAHELLLPALAGAGSFLALWPGLLLLRFGRWLRSYLS